MHRISLMLLLCLASLSAFSATLIVDGKPVALPVVESNGKALVDIVALMKLLGGAGSYDALVHKVSIITPGAMQLGNTELAGDNGVFGKVYSLRKDSPLYFSLKSAEYTTGQIVSNDRLFSPKADDKLLVLHFSVQNPQKGELFIRGDMALSMTVVDSMNVNHAPTAAWADEQNHQGISLRLKPMQKIDVYNIFTVPAKGSAPKLMVLPGENNGPILRYDLHDKVKPLAAPYADPADPTGATALTVVPQKLNVRCPFDTWSASVDGFATVTEPVLDRKLEHGDTYLLVSMTVRNENTFRLPLRFDTFNGTLVSGDGEKLDSRGLILGSSYRAVGQPVESGDEMHVRMVFIVPHGVTPKTFTLRQGDSRLYTFAVKP